MSKIGSLSVPMDYSNKNLYNAFISPSTVHCRNTNLQFYYRRYLMQKAISVFKWDIPETWDKDYFLYTLYSYGYCAVINTEEFGVIPQWGALGGFNVFYRPKYHSRCCSTSASVPNGDRTIHRCKPPLQEARYP